MKNNRIHKIPTKYHSRGCKCLSGHYHDSRKEATHCNRLLADLQDGKIKSYKTQVSYALNINGHKICRHIVDFVVENNDGSIVVNEVKGFATKDWKIKYKLFEALYPDIEYHVFY